MAGENEGRVDMRGRERQTFVEVVLAALVGGLALLLVWIHCVLVGIER